MGNLFLEITIIICLAAFLSLVFRFLKQPAILAYILTGIIVGPLGFFGISGEEFLHTMGEFGITLLLFMLGLELKFSDLKSVGKVAVLTGLSQIVLTSLVGFGIGILLGFDLIVSLYIAIALTFSSTIIIVKLLSDKKDLHSLYGKISIGFLLVQDFVAIILLMVLSGFSASEGKSINILDFGLILLKGGIIFTLILWLSKSVFPRIIHVISRSLETLFLFSIAFALLMSSLVSSSYVGFSIEIGGFLAGLALANSSQNIQIVTKIRPLRDFFITIFFVILGMRLVFGDPLEILIPSIIFSAFILIGNPIIVMVIMGLLGYRKRTSFLAGLTVAQISEFSLIVIFLGNRIGHLSDSVVSMVTLVGITTFTVSTYMILNGEKLYRSLKPLLGIFERKKTNEEGVEISERNGHVILIGAGRVGESILDALEDSGYQVLVVDFDPDVVSSLKNRGVDSFYGDISDLEIQERVWLHNAKLVISTVSDEEDNLHLIKMLNRTNRTAKVVVLAEDGVSAKILYKAGADYVVLPHLAGGRHMARILKEDRLSDLEVFKKRDMKHI